VRKRISCIVCLWVVYGAAVGLCMSDSTEDPSTEIHTLGETSRYVPREAHDPTPAEEKQQTEQYRVHPNKGFIVSDDARGQLRQPTEKESKAAIKRGIAYHKKHKKTFDALTAGTPVNATTPENEENLARWNNAAQPDPVSGVVRYNMGKYDDIMRTNEAQWKKARKKRMAKHPTQGYTPHQPGSAIMPRGEPVVIKELTGRDEEVTLNPTIHMPPWAGCISGAQYVQHFHNDLIDELRKQETLMEKTNTWMQCKEECTQAKYDCLGYLRHDKGTEVGVPHDCWLLQNGSYPGGIPNSSYPGGLRSVLQEWQHGSIWLKDMKTAANVKNCTGYTSPPNIVAASDWGDTAEITEPTSEDVDQIKAKAKTFYAGEVKAMDEHEDVDMVDKARNVSILYRQQQESAYVKERLHKSVETREAGLLKTQERTKKTKIVKALHDRTQHERNEKAKVLHAERRAKAKQEQQDEEAKSKERAFKKTPEGMLHEAGVQEQQKSAADEADSKRAEATKKYMLWVKEAHVKERARLASLNRNISIALNATKQGNATREQFELLDREGIPSESEQNPYTNETQTQTQTLLDELETDFSSDDVLY